MNFLLLHVTGHGTLGRGRAGTFGQGCNHERARRLFWSIQYKKCVQTLFQFLSP